VVVPSLSKTMPRCLLCSSIEYYNMKISVMIWFIWQTYSTFHHNARHPNEFSHISCLIASPKHPTSNDASSHLGFNHISRRLLHHSRWHLLIPSFLTKPTSRHYLPSLLWCFGASTTTWISEWMKHLRTAISLVLMQDHEARMSPWGE
jgi:hypothetical protein